jgi:chemotaxis protein histidine kinase CheA
MIDERGGASADFEAVLRQFRAEFTQQLPARLQDAQDRLRDCLAAPGDDEPLRELHRVLHRLAGSAGTFGHAQLGEDARAIEDLLDDLLLRTPRTADDFAPVAQRLQALVRAAPAA